MIFSNRMTQQKNGEVLLAEWVVVMWEDAWQYGGTLKFSTCTVVVVVIVIIFVLVHQGRQGNASRR